MQDLSVQELKARIDQGDAPVMIDVREPYEWAMQTLDGVEKISMMKLMAPEVHEQLRAYGEQEVVFICRSGARSAQATALARRLGLTNARNLAGGMMAWQAEVDSTFNVA